MGSVTSARDRELVDRAGDLEEPDDLRADRPKFQVCLSSGRAAGRGEHAAQAGRIHEVDAREIDDDVAATLRKQLGLAFQQRLLQIGPPAMSMSRRR
jgi:hypothetical protein